MSAFLPAIVIFVCIFGMGFCVGNLMRLRLVRKALIKVGEEINSGNPTPEKAARIQGMIDVIEIVNRP